MLGCSNTWPKHQNTESNASDWVRLQEESSMNSTVSTISASSMLNTNFGRFSLTCTSPSGPGIEQPIKMTLYATKAKECSPADTEVKIDIKPDTISTKEVKFILCPMGQIRPFHQTCSPLVVWRLTKKKLRARHILKVWRVQRTFCYNKSFTFCSSFRVDW